jgi:hypothetical protein
LISANFKGGCRKRRLCVYDRFTKKTDLKNYKFDLIVKLLNPARAAQNYFVGLKGKHRQINKSDTVRENIEGEFAVWKNKLKKDVREIVTLHSLDDEAFAILEKEAVMKIEAAEAQYNFILNHFDDLEVRIAGYTHEVIYPYVSYRIKGENIQKHLSIKVPSVLYYESVKYRSDMAVADFIKNATNAFGDIYYIEKEKTQ